MKHEGDDIVDGDEHEDAEAGASAPSSSSRPAPAAEIPEPPASEPASSSSRPAPAAKEPGPPAKRRRVKSLPEKVVAAAKKATSPKYASLNEMKAVVKTPREHAAPASAEPYHTDSTVQTKLEDLDGVVQSPRIHAAPANMTKHDESHLNQLGLVDAFVRNAPPAADASDIAPPAADASDICKEGFEFFTRLLKKDSAKYLQRFRERVQSKAPLGAVNGKFFPLEAMREAIAKFDETVP